MRLNRSVNHEGAESFDGSPKTNLTKLTINNLIEDTYYREDTTALEELHVAFAEVADSDPEFPLKLAAYARQEHYLRDVPTILLVWASRHEEAKKFVPSYATEVLARADEPGKAIAFHEHWFGPISFEDRAEEWLKSGFQMDMKTTARNARLKEALENGDVKSVAKTENVFESISSMGKPINKPLKRAIENALHEFDEYQFAKYDNGDFRMRDILNLVHPKPRDSTREKIFESIILGDMDDHPEITPLETPETWEAVISSKGNNYEAWAEVLPKMGLFAKTRNLRNMAKAGIRPDQIFNESDFEYADSSKMYPFRFFQAYMALGPHRMMFKEPLERLVSSTMGNVELENTHIAVDLSGSMDKPLAHGSSITYKEIACFFGAILSYSGNVIAFAETAEEVTFDESMSVFDRAKKIRSTHVGGATNGWKAIDKFKQEAAYSRRIIYLTDMQIWDSAGFGFRSSGRTVKDAYETLPEDIPLVMVDLSSYGDLTFPEGYDNVASIQGWNEKIIDWLDNFEEGYPIDEIENYSLK